MKLVVQTIVMSIISGCLGYGITKAILNFL